MQDSVLLALVVGLISLVSTLSGIALQHWLEILKINRQKREHFTHIIYDKQTEFFDKLAEILPKINSYITTIDVWLGERSPEAKERVKEAAEDTTAVSKLFELLDLYYMYLPNRLLDQANKLIDGCMNLSRLPGYEQTQRSIKLLFSFQNTVRECVGIDELSTELLKTFAPPSEERKSK